MGMGFGSISGRLVEQQGYRAKWESRELSRVLSAFGEEDRGVCAHMCTFRMDPYTAEKKILPRREDPEFSRGRDFAP